MRERAFNPSIHSMTRTRFVERSQCILGTATSTYASRNTTYATPVRASQRQLGNLTDISSAARAGSVRPVLTNCWSRTEVTLDSSGRTPSGGGPLGASASRAQPGAARRSRPPGGNQAPCSVEEKDEGGGIINNEGRRESFSATARNVAAGAV